MLVLSPHDMRHILTSLNSTAKTNLQPVILMEHYISGGDSQ
jgi:hypothetical protein